MGIWEEGDFYDQEDLNLFFAKYARNIPQGFHPIANYIDGAEAPGDVAGAGAESTMDFELAYPLLYPQNIVLYQTDDINYATQHPTAGSFNTFLDAIDGVSLASICDVPQAYGGSRTVPTLRLAKQAMTQFSTPSTRIQQRMATKES